MLHACVRLVQALPLLVQSAAAFSAAATCIGCQDQATRTATAAAAPAPHAWLGAKQTPQHYVYM